MNKLKEICRKTNAFIKRYTILRWVFGMGLAVISLLLLSAFFYNAFTPHYFSAYRANTAGFIIWWLVILGTGVPAGFMLRKAILNLKNKTGAKNDTDDSGNTETAEADL